MRTRHWLPAVPLCLLLAGCDDPPPPVVLIHASDPHLLDRDRRRDELTNLAAFEDMMDAVGRLEAGSPTPSYLVITGDLGIEWSDPRRTPGTPVLPGTQAVSGAAATLAEQRREDLANLVASEIQGGPFEHVYFVPGNNDVFLEDARPSEWRGVDAFVQSVQSRLDGKTFVDLTACYRMARFRPGDCYARLPDGLVLVGFPSMSFKNETKPGDFPADRDHLGIDPALSLDAGLTRLARRQDTVHAELLIRLRQVLADATAGGSRALIVTHIPDLDDPYHAGNPQARDTLSRRLRLGQPPGFEAWNVDSLIHDEWKAIVQSPRVAGVLAGHFHDSIRGTYYRPYGALARRNAADPWKTFVAPPLAAKNQPGRQARGFARVTLTTSTVGRRLYWYDASRHAFTPDTADEPGRVAAITAPTRRFSMNPMQSRLHGATFLVALLTALASARLWIRGQATLRRDAAAMKRAARRTKGWWGSMSPRTRARIRNGIRGLLPQPVGVSVVVIMQAIWAQRWTLPLYTIAWFFVLLLLAVAVASSWPWWVASLRRLRLIADGWTVSRP